MTGLSALARYAAPRPATAPACELCGAAIGPTHRHVVELGNRGVHCTCGACAVLFARSDSTGMYRTVPDRVQRDPAFALGADAWARLGVPVGLAFVVRSAGRALLNFPGPAGVTDGELAPEGWDALVAATPLAAQLAEDVEALLVYGARGALQLVCYLVPITAAFELTSTLRACWRGFDGGDEARAALGEFFATLDRRGGHR